MTNSLINQKTQAESISYDDNCYAMSASLQDF